MRHALMEDPEKLSGLLREVGLTSVHVWCEEFRHAWSVESLLRMQLRCGMPARRLATLSAPRQAACRARVEERLNRLSSEDLVARHRALYGVARRPG